VQSAIMSMSASCMRQVAAHAWQRNYSEWYMLGLITAYQKLGSAVMSNHA